MRIARYTTVSALSIALTQALLQVLARSGMTAGAANASAVMLAALPAFVLNRRWTWRDRSVGTPVGQQAVVFWVTVVGGLVASTCVVSVTARETHEPLVLGAASVATFGALWGIVVAP